MDNIQLQNLKKYPKINVAKTSVVFAILLAIITTGTLIGVLVFGANNPEQGVPRPLWLNILEYSTLPIALIVVGLSLASLCFDIKTLQEGKKRQAIASLIIGFVTCLWILTCSIINFVTLFARPGPEQIERTGFEYLGLMLVALFWIIIANILYVIERKDKGLIYVNNSTSIWLLVTTFFFLPFLLTFIVLSLFGLQEIPYTALGRTIKRIPICLSTMLILELVMTCILPTNKNRKHIAILATFSAICFAVSSLFTLVMPANEYGSPFFWVQFSLCLVFILFISTVSIVMGFKVRKWGKKYE